MFYCGAMNFAGRAAEIVVRDRVQDSHGRRVKRVVASPVFADPLRREVIIETEEGFLFGDFRWGPTPRLRLERQPVATEMDRPEIARTAVTSKRLRDYLYWARFPFAELGDDNCGIWLTVNDGRFTRRVGSGPFRLQVLVPRADSTAAAVNPACSP